MSMAYADDADSEDVDKELADIVEAKIEERRGQVLLMKLAGATFSTIAERHKVSISTTRKDYEIALRSHMRETPEMMLARHHAIITDVMRANYPRMLDGDKDAAMVILTALREEAKRFGLDAPTRVVAQIGAEDFTAEAAMLVRKIQKLDPTELKELTRVGRHHTIDVEVVEDQPVVASVAEGLRADAFPEHPGEPFYTALPPACPRPTYTDADAGVEAIVENRRDEGAEGLRGALPGGGRSGDDADPRIDVATDAGDGDGRTVDAPFTDDGWSNID